jgi:hypothetical protein
MLGAFSQAICRCHRSRDHADSMVWFPDNRHRGDTRRVSPTTLHSVWDLYPMSTQQHAELYNLQNDLSLTLLLKALCSFRCWMEDQSHSGGVMEAEAKVASELGGLLASAIGADARSDTKQLTKIWRTSFPHLCPIRKLLCTAILAVAPHAVQSVALLHQRRRSVQTGSGERLFAHTTDCTKQSKT